MRLILTEEEVFEAVRQYLAKRGVNVLDIRFLIQTDPEDADVTANDLEVTCELQEKESNANDSTQ